MLFLSKFDLESWMIKNFCIKALSIRIGSSLFYLHSNKCKMYWKTIKWKPSSLGERNFSITFEGESRRRGRRFVARKRDISSSSQWKLSSFFSHWSHPPPFCWSRNEKEGRRGKKLKSPGLIWWRKPPGCLTDSDFDGEASEEKMKAKTRILASWSSFQRNTNYSQAQLQI